MNSILRGFEMVSGLKINFLKSSLIGVNVREKFMEMACDFLNCSKGVFRSSIWVCRWEKMDGVCLPGNHWWMF